MNECCSDAVEMETYGTDKSAIRQTTRVIGRERIAVETTTSNDEAMDEDRKRACKSREMTNKENRSVRYAGFVSFNCKSVTLSKRGNTKDDNWETVRFSVAHISHLSALRTR